MTKTLECVPRQWKVVERHSEEGQLPLLRGDQPAAGTLASDRPRPGRPHLLALVLAAKYGEHLPRDPAESAIYAREGSSLTSRPWRTGSARRPPA